MTTNTPPQGPTNTPVTGGALKVQLANGGNDNNQQVAFHYKIQNTGSSAQSNITVRIYFTLDGSQAASKYVLEKYWDQSGVATVSGPTQVSGSSYYFTVNYGSTSLAAGGSWEFHTAMHLNDWSNNFSSSNDWWRATGSMPSSYSDWSNIPAYVSGSRVWVVNQVAAETQLTHLSTRPANTDEYICASNLDTYQHSRWTHCYEDEYACQSDCDTHQYNSSSHSYFIRWWFLLGDIYQYQRLGCRFRRQRHN